MNQQNIYQNNNQIFKEILSMYKPEQILYAPIEIGKFNHQAQVVNFIVHHLKQQNFPIEIINPRDTKKENPNKNSKTDIIDLNAIARILISNKGGRQIVPQGVYYNLQRVTRTRNSSKKEPLLKIPLSALLTESSPAYGIKIIPSFLINGVKQVSSYYKITHILIKLFNWVKINSLVSLEKNNTKLGDKTAKKIIEIAKDSLSKPLTELSMDIFALKFHIQSLVLYNHIIDELEQEIARLFIQTPGTYLLSGNGISLIYASEFTAEVGDINSFAYANQIISFAGSCSRIFESA